MLLFGCLLAFVFAFTPRIVLILAWIFGSRWDVVFTTWFWPLLGIIFAPYTTIMFLLVWSPPRGITGFDFIWLGLGVAMDLIKWSNIAANRRGIPGYPESAY